METSYDSEDFSEGSDWLLGLFPTPPSLPYPSTPIFDGGEYGDVEMLYPHNTVCSGNHSDAQYHDTFAQDSPHPMLAMNLMTAASKRAAPDDGIEELQTPHKVPKVGYQPPMLDDEEQDEMLAFRHTHALSTFGSAKYSCTCGKVYTKLFALNRHINGETGRRFECHECHQLFTRKDSLQRHVDMEHRGNKHECIGCQRTFRPDAMREHLANPPSESCRALVHSLHIRSHGLSMDARPIAESFWDSGIAQKVPHRTGNRAVSRDNSNPSEGLGAISKPVASAVQYYQGYRMRALLRPSQEPCVLCRMPLGSNERELVDHAQHHMQELSTRRFRCKQCDIDFAFAADLHLHLESATTNGTCGFNFLHQHSMTLDSATTACTGHHPPSGKPCSYDDHDRMEVTLWRWQAYQVRAIRIAIARLQAELLLSWNNLRHSLGNDELMCLELLSRLSIGSIASFRSAPELLQSSDREAMLSGSHRTTPLLLEPPRDSAADARNARKENAVEQRTLQNAHDSIELLRDTKNTYTEQLRSMRAPDGLKSRASGVHYRSAVAKRFLLPENWVAKGPGQVQYVVNIVAT